MKQTACYFLGLSLILTLFVITAASSFAQENSDDQTTQRRKERDEMILQRSENAQNRVQKINEKIQKGQEVRQERRANIAQNHAERLSNRFGFYSQRLVNLIVKIKSSLEAMAADGKDVTEALNKINEAQEALDNAKLLGEKAVAEFSAIDPENYESQRDQALAAKEIADQAREEFKNAVTLMRESIKLAKDSIKEAE